MPATSAIDFHKARDFGEVMNASFFFIRQNFKPLLLSLVFLAGPFVLVGSVLPGLLMLPWVGGASNEFITSDSSGVGNILTSSLVNVLSFIVGAVMAVGTVYEYMLLYRQRGPGNVQTNDVWRAIRRDFFRILLTFVGLLVVATGVFMPLGLLMAGGATAAVISVFLFMPLSIYLTVTLSFVPIIRIHERVGLITAIRRSFALIKGKWWQTFGLFFICYVVQSAMISVVFIPFFLFFGVQQLISTDVSSMEGAFVSVVLGGILLVMAVMVSFCLGLIVTGFQYFSLAERKDATGLLAKINSMGTPAAQVNQLSEEENY